MPTVGARLFFQVDCVDSHEPAGVGIGGWISLKICTRPPILIGAHVTTRSANE